MRFTSKPERINQTGSPKVTTSAGRNEAEENSVTKETLLDGKVKKKSRLQRWSFKRKMKVTKSGSEIVIQKPTQSEEKNLTSMAKNDVLQIRDSPYSMRKRHYSTGYLDREQHVQDTSRFGGDAATDGYRSQEEPSYVSGRETPTEKNCHFVTEEAGHTPVSRGLIKPLEPKNAAAILRKYVDKEKLEEKLATNLSNISLKTPKHIKKQEKRDLTPTISKMESVKLPDIIQETKGEHCMSTNQKRKPLKDIQTGVKRKKSFLQKITNSQSEKKLQKTLVVRDDSKIMPTTQSKIKRRLSLNLGSSGAPMPQLLKRKADGTPKKIDMKVESTKLNSHGAGHTPPPQQRRSQRFTDGQICIWGSQERLV